MTAVRVLALSLLVVFYVLDGRAHFVHSVGSVDFLASHGEIPETIVVAVASTVRVRDFTQTDGPGGTW